MCIFCDIVENKINSYTIYEDDIVKCFLDLNQECLGHTLVIPKKHTLDINSIDDETISHIYKISKMIMKRCEEKLKCDGITLLQNNGIAQDVKHFHLHILPKYENKYELSMEEVYEKLKED